MRAGTYEELALDSSVHVDEMWRIQARNGPMFNSYSESFCCQSEFERRAICPMANLSPLASSGTRRDAA